MTEIVLIIISFAASFFITGVICRHAEKLNLIDVPNDRSSHYNPTPSGGGIAIVITFTSVTLCTIFSGNTYPVEMSYYLAALLLTAAVGLWDDLRTIPASLRLPIHLAASLLIAIPLINHYAPLTILGLDPGRPLVALAIVVALAWLLNLYNFMDGIDGIAASEAVFVATGGAILLYYAGENQLAWLLLALAASSAGFLAWNWPPARVFMGDAGSGFLGLALGGVALYSAAFSEGICLWPWIILFGVFLVDATFTLAMRMLQGQQWYAAHRSHTYQKAALSFGSHRKVTTATVGINVLWLLPLAFLATKHPEYGMYCALIAIAPLLGLVFFFKAGIPGAENQNRTEPL